MVTAGIDIGSITTKAAIMEDGVLVGTAIDFTGYNASEAGDRVFASLLEKAGKTMKDVDFIISTGYGRNTAAFARKSVTEISCHGAGARYLNPAVRGVIDIGGQDSKVIVLDETGRVRDFAMNDKCAAGTGRFLEVMARALHSDLDNFGTLSLRAGSPAKISSVCTVFAESEIISLIAKGEARENIIAGIHESVAARISAMVKRTGMVPPVMMTGGVAKNTGVVRAIEARTGWAISVSEHTQLNGAIGAAFLATKECGRNETSKA